jgi:hypothetical protein
VTSSPSAQSSGVATDDSLGLSEGVSRIDSAVGKSRMDRWDHRGEYLASNGDPVDVRGVVHGIAARVPHTSARHGRVSERGASLSEVRATADKALPFCETPRFEPKMTATNGSHVSWCPHRWGAM